MTLSALRRYTLAICGFGHIAEHQLRALAHRPHSFELAAICDINPARLHGLPVPAFPSLRELYDFVQPDAVLVSVPNALHAAVTMEVLGRGSHVLVEKPATTNLSEFDQCAAAADAAGRVFHTAFHAAFGPEVEWFVSVKERLTESWGVPRSIVCGFYDPYIIAGRLEPRALPLQGSWIDSGINELSVLTRVVDTFRVERLRRTSLEAIAATEVQGMAICTFGAADRPDCGVAILDTNWTLGINRKTTDIWFDRGDRLLLDHTQRHAFHQPSGESARLIEDFSQIPLDRLSCHYLGVFDDFHAALESGKDNRSVSRRLLEALYAPVEP